MLDLNRSWSRAWRGVGAAASGDDVVRALVTAWSERHRAYHTLQHLRECLALFETVSTLATRPAEVEAALWFHDAVYEPTQHDNEARSAAWAVQALGDAGVVAHAIWRVEAQVLATRHAAAAGDADQQLLLDIDLAILGASPERFAEYDAQIRAEYAHVAEPVSRAAPRRAAGLSRPPEALGNAGASRSSGAGCARQPGARGRSGLARRRRHCGGRRTLASTCSSGSRKPRSCGDAARPHP